MAVKGKHSKKYIIKKKYNGYFLGEGEGYEILPKR